jgi:hypothetical protein
VVMGALLGPEGTAADGGCCFSTGLVDLVKPFASVWVWVGAGCIWGSFVV